MSIHDELVRIPQSLHAPKENTNTFGKYNYRSAEGILAAVKPLLNGCTLVLSDDMRLVGDRVYVEAIVTLSDGEQVVKASSFARETLVQKGMNDAQITGSSSSYARKYALSGLFAIDNEKDADTKEGPSVIEQINAAFSRDELTGLWQQMTEGERKEHKEEFIARGKELEQES